MWFKPRNCAIQALPAIREGVDEFLAHLEDTQNLLTAVRALMMFLCPRNKSVRCDVVCIYVSGRLLSHCSVCNDCLSEELQLTIVCTWAWPAAFGTRRGLKSYKHASSSSWVHFGASAMLHLEEAFCLLGIVALLFQDSLQCFAQYT